MNPSQLEDYSNYYHPAEVQEICNKLRCQMENEINIFSWMSSSTKLQQSPCITLENNSLPMDLCYDMSDKDQILVSSSQSSDELITLKEKRDFSDLKVTLEEIEEKTSKILDIICGNDEDEFSLIFQILNEIPLCQLNDVCHNLHLDKLQENSYLQFSQEFVKSHETLSYTSLTTLWNFLFIQKIQNIERSISRIELMAVLHLATSFSQLAIDGILHIMKILNPKNFQYEIFAQIIKEALQGKNERLLGQFLQTILKWNDFHLLFLQHIIETKIQLSDEIIASLLQRLSEHADDFKTNLKFSKLVQGIILNYSKQFGKNDLLLLKTIISLNETFLKKSLEGTLEKNKM